MPIVYLALGLVAGLWLVAKGGTRRSDRASVSPTFAAPLLNQLIARPDPKAQPAPQLVSDAILRTSEGLRRKVVVRELDLVPRKTPDGDAKGNPLDYYGVRYVLGESPTMLQVGPPSGVPDGWVPRESVVEWNTRLMARPSPRGSRPALMMNREESCAAAAASGRPCPNHARGCPIEGEEAPAGSPEPPLGWPVLQSRPIPGSRPIYEVAAPVWDRAPPAPRPEWLKSMQPALRQIYVAFVIDTTTSMAANFDAVKGSVRNLIDRLAK
ncbi:MAG TPA: VWA domain-containing protein, partial [Thermoanaerobaculia bacterium]